MLRFGLGSAVACVYTTACDSAKGAQKEHACLHHRAACIVEGAWCWLGCVEACMLYYDGCDGCTTGSLLALLYCVAACMLVRITRLRRLDHEQNSKAATLHGMHGAVVSRAAKSITRHAKLHPRRCSPGH